MNSLDLFNRLARHARPAHTDYTPLDSLDVPWGDTGLDSMDGLMMVIFLSDVYGVPEVTAKEFSFATPAELMALADQHKTQTPSSVDAAMEAVQW